MNRSIPTAALPLLLIPVVLLIVASQLGRPVARSVSDVQPPPEADYYLRDAEVSTMAADGSLLYRVTADKVLHYPDDSIGLEQVSVDYVDGPWKLNAQQGHIPPGQPSLALSGAVQMQGRLQSGQELHLQTESITMEFEQRRISTDRTVHMQAQNIAAQSLGMVTDLAGKELRLQSEVRVRYEP